MRRWIIRIAVLLAVLAVAFVAGTWILLRTSLPGRWILRAASQRLGMEVRAESLSVRWLGRTRIRNLTVERPLDAEPFLAVETAVVSHQAIPLMLLKRSVGLRAVCVESPRLHLRRDEDGAWNVQDIARRLQSRRSSDGRPARTRLPSIDLSQGFIDVTDPNGAVQTIGPVAFHAASEERFLWVFSLKAPPAMGIEGRLAPTDGWAHTVRFALTQVEPALGTLVGQPLSGLQAAGRWEGKISGEELSGRLTLDELDLGGVAAHGDVSVTARGGAVTLQPGGLMLTEPNLAGQPAQWTGGSVHISRAGLRLEQLAGGVAGLGVRLGGQWDWGERAGEFTGSWAGRLPGDGCACQGAGEVSVQSPRFGRREAQVQLTAALESPLGSGEAAITARGTGADWSVSRWDISASKLAWSRRDGQISLSDALAKVNLAWPDVRLTRLELPEAQRVRAEAEFQADTRHWSVHVDANGLQPGGYAGADVDISLRGRGDARQATISRFSVKQGAKRIAVRGTLPVSGGRLEGVHVAADWPGGPPQASAAKPTDRSGRWHCEADVVGKIKPVEIEVKGALSGHDVRLGKRTVERVDIPLRAEVDANQVNVATEAFDLLAGRWQINGRHRFSEQITQLALSVDKLSLKAAAEMAGSPVQCRGVATAQLHLAVPAFNVHKAVASGSWRAEGVAIAPIEAQQARGKLRVSDGLVRFDDIHLVQAAGQADGSMQFQLERPQSLSIAFKMDAWPLEWQAGTLELRLNSEADVLVDVLAKTVEGQGRLSSQVLWKDREFGDVALSGRVQGRTLEIAGLSGHALGGSVEGNMRIPLDRWTDSTAQVQWREVQFDRLQQWWPELAGLAGGLSGSLTVRPACGGQGQPRALEPMQVDVHAEMADGRFGAAHIGDADVTAYVGPKRLLIDGASLCLLGGQANVRARVSPHAGQFYGLVVTDFNNLSVDQIAHVIDPNDASFEGKLGGRVTVLLSSDLRAFGGEATVTLKDSDLVNNSIVRALYDTLSLDSQTKRPTGSGQIQMRLEGRTLEIPGFAYFNRGVEIRGAGAIEDIGLGPKSPVQGYAVGSTRVLKEIRLPGVKELDRLMASLQTGVASVQVKGTLTDPQVTVVPLPVVSNAFRRLLWSQLKE